MPNSGNTSGKSDDATIPLTVRIDRRVHNAVQRLIADGDVFASPDDLICTFLEAVTCRPAGPPGQKSLLDLLVFAAWQRGQDFETTLFGRPGNEHDRRQLYSLMLGFNRLDFVNTYEQREFRSKGATTFARDVAYRFARDLDREDATRLIETMTVGSPALHAEMLHWLDVAAAENADDPPGGA